MARWLFGMGIEPGNLFIQSTVPQHMQLHWVLSCLSPMGTLNRMTQWKAKAKNKNKENLGLFSYPVLQAADILLYRAEAVPVGEDQKQHLELTRDIAQIFNSKYPGYQFTFPEAILPSTEWSTRIMSLKNPQSKMSKSAVDASKSCIMLSDSMDDVVKKIRGAQTDSLNGIHYDPEARPGVANLLAIYAGLRDETGSDLQLVVERDQLANLSMVEFKKHVSDVICAVLKPIQERATVLDDEHVAVMLRRGNERAQAIALYEYQNIARAIGLHT